MQKYQIKDSKKHGLGVFATQDFKSGDIIEVSSEGFVLHDRLLRPAHVGVSSNS